MGDVRDVLSCGRIHLRREPRPPGWAGGTGGLTFGPGRLSWDGPLRRTGSVLGEEPLPERVRER